MGLFENKVVVITGGARGQGRAHAIRFAEEGATVVVSDIAKQVSTVPYPMGSEEDLSVTVSQVEALGRRCISVSADARSMDQMKDLAATAVQEFGSIDVLVVNHGIATEAAQGAGGGWLAEHGDAGGGGWNAADEVVDDVLNINLRGAFNACRAAIPHMLKQRQGGSIVLTSSAAGLGPYYGLTAYTMSKHGVVGLARSLAVDMGHRGIRVNAVCPGLVDTPMVMGEEMLTQFTGKASGATKDDMIHVGRSLGVMAQPWLDPQDIANAVVWLASDQARGITGVALPVDLGTSIQPAGTPPAYVDPPASNS